ncbi:MAG: SAM-dependent chlorinase/fluorinase [Cyanobacteria bacterium P01_A01_bin.135]
MPPVALITDFGLQDTYVGVMKGVMTAIAPQLTYLDLTHSVSPQDIHAAQFHLLTAYPYLPAGTVYLVVVDPGVGSDRRAVAVQFPFGTVVCPDNGILTGLLHRYSSDRLKAVTLTRPAYWRQSAPASISATFHGRDIFAPVAAHLAVGVPLATVGDPIAPAQLIQRPDLVIPTSASRGVIQHIDHFGNLISTITAQVVEAISSPWQVLVGSASDVLSHGPIPCGSRYSSVPAGQLVALVGSHGWVEVAANGASARNVLGATVGTQIALQEQGRQMEPQRFGQTAAGADKPTV